MKNNSTSGQSALQAKLREELKQEYKGFVIEPSFLRAEQIITNTSSAYNFDITKNGNEAVTEKKLDKNDVFVASHVGILVTPIETAKPSKCIMYTYPNSSAFTASGGTPSDLEVIYNGVLGIKINTKEYISALSGHNFRCVPDAQKSGATNQDQRTYLDGLFEVGRLRFSGLDQIGIRHDVVTFAGIDAAAVTAGFQNRIVFFANGFLIKGAAQSVSRLEPGA